MTRRCCPCWVTLMVNRNVILTFLIPAILSLIPILVPGQPSKGAFILALMAIYWITEVIPIYVTALLPVLLGPLLGILPSDKLCPAYMKDTNMLFLGGIFIACAIEHHGLHKRIALWILKIVGSDPKMLLLGFMLPTWFLSMWMSNTAATAMMMPLIEAVLVSLNTIELESQRKKAEGVELRDVELRIGGPKDPVQNPDSAPENQQQTQQTEECPSLRKFSMGFCLSTAYASSCGGIATLTGTPPNAVFLGFLNGEFGTSTGMNFGTWMGYAVPISVVMVTVMWLWLGLIYIGPKKFFSCAKDKEKEKSVAGVIDAELQKLGEFKYAEGVVAGLFVAVVLLWVSRKPGNVGWGKLFDNVGLTGYVSDTQPAFLICLLALILPEKNPREMWKCRYGSRRNDPPEPPVQPILPWGVVQRKSPWGIMFLLGGGYALSDICNTSGLSNEIGQFLSSRVSGLPIPALILVCTLTTSLLTEFVSNVATASILLPIMFSLAKNLSINPLILTLPVTIASSLAFSLPAGTPPNSIIFAKGRVQVKHMILTGYPMNLFGNLVILVATTTYAWSLFDLGTLPSWAQSPPAN